MNIEHQPNTFSHLNWFIAIVCLPPYLFTVREHFHPLCAAYRKWYVDAADVRRVCAFICFTILIAIRNQHRTICSTYMNVIWILTTICLPLGYNNNGRAVPLTWNFWTKQHEWPSEWPNIMIFIRGGFSHIHDEWIPNEANSVRKRTGRHSTTGRHSILNRMGKKKHQRHEGRQEKKTKTKKEKKKTPKLRNFEPKYNEPQNRFMNTKEPDCIRSSTLSHSLDSGTQKKKKMHFWEFEWWNLFRKISILFIRGSRLEISNES